MTLENLILYTVEGPMLTMVCGIGLLGNAALFFTFVLQKGTARGQTSPLKPFMMYLASNDFMMLTVSWILFSLPVYVQLQTNCTFVHVLPYLITFNYMLHASHIWCNVALATDRFLAICLPIWSKTRKPKFLHVVMLVFASIVSFGYGIPKLSELQSMPAERNLTNFVIGCRISENYSEILMPTELSSTSYAYHIGYKIIAKLMIVSTFPTLILLSLTVCMITKVHNSITTDKRLNKNPLVCKKKREKHTDHEVIPLRKYGMDQQESPMVNFHVAKALLQQVSLTAQLVAPNYKLHKIQDKRMNIYKCLISVFIVAVICNTLPAVLNIMDLVANIEYVYTKYLNSISNTLVLLDASSTFYLCIALSKQFRKLLMKQK